MRIHLAYGVDITATVSCDDAFIWTGSLLTSPDWLVEMVEVGDAVVLSKQTKSIMINHRNGQTIADVGDLIYIKSNRNINVIRLDK